MHSLTPLKFVKSLLNKGWYRGPLLQLVPSKNTYLYFFAACSIALFLACPWCWYFAANSDVAYLAWPHTVWPTMFVADLLPFLISYLWLSSKFFQKSDIWNFPAFMRGAVFVVAMAIFASSSAKADVVATIPHCPEFLAEADLFYDQCNANARSFSRRFYPSGIGVGDPKGGVQEEYSAWFSTAPANSHFVMGCMKNRHGLRFLGIYYTLEPSAIAQANTAPIQAISADGAVVLTIDNHSVTFVPARHFRTDKIKTFWDDSSEINANCVPSLGADGYYDGGTSNRVAADFSQYDSKHLVKIGDFPSTQTTEEYVEFLPSTSPRHDVLYHEGMWVIVESTGAVLVKKSVLENKCKEGFRARMVQSPMLFHQICRMTNNLPSR